jgi:anti-anti-sigma factor
MLVVKKQSGAGVVVLEINDSIRLGPNLQQIDKSFDEVLRQNEKWVILDLTRVTYIDSSGIGTIVRMLGRLKKIGGTLRMAGVKGMVEGAFKLTQVDKIIEMYPTADAASRDFPPVPNP